MDTSTKTQDSRRESVGAVLISNSLANFAAMAVSFCITLVFTPLVVKAMGDETFGLFSLGFAVMGLVSFFYLGITDSVTQAVARGYSIGPPEGNRSLGVSLSLYCVGSVCSALSMYFLGPMLAESFFSIPHTEVERAKTLFKVLSIGIPPTVFIIVGSSALRGVHQYGKAGFLWLLQGSMSLPIAWFSIQAGQDIVGFATSYVFSLWGFTLIALPIIFRSVGKPVFRTPGFLERLKMLWTFNVFIALTSLGALLWSTLDRNLVGSFLGAASLTYYVVPWSLASKIYIGVGALAHVVLPATAEQSVKSAEDERTAFFERMFALFTLLTFSLATALYVAGDSLLLLWVGREFVLTSGPLFKCLIIGFAISAVGTVPYYYFAGEGKPRPYAIITLVAGLGAALANIVLLPKLGLIGAGLASVIFGIIQLGLFLGWFSKQKGFTGIVRKFLLIPFAALLLSLTALELTGLVSSSPTEVEPLSVLLRVIGAVLFFVITILAIDYAVNASAISSSMGFAVSKAWIFCRRWIYIEK